MKTLCTGPLVTNVTLILKIGSQSNDNCNGNKKDKKAIRQISKTTTLHMNHAFLYIIFLAVVVGLQCESA